MVIDKLKALLGGNQKKRKRILIVDDEDHILELLELHLTRMDYVVTKANSIERAQKIVSQNSDIRLVITDISMPGGSGLSLIKNIRKDKTNRRIPVLILSGKLPMAALEGLKQDFERVEVEQKPIKANRLKELVEQGIKTGFTDTTTV